MSRKIIQICGNKALDEILAVCDDGTAWQSYRSSPYEWHEWYQLPPIPQDTTDKKPEIYWNPADGRLSDSSEKAGE